MLIDASDGSRECPNSHLRDNRDALEWTVFQTLQQGTAITQSTMQLGEPMVCGIKSMPTFKT